MTGGVIAENRAGNYGGAICTLPDVRDGATGDISITIYQQAVIRDNYSDNGGGAIAAWELNGIATHLLISGGEITGNEARNNGGGLFVYGTDSDELVSMTGGAISGNEASYGGGIILYSNSNAKMSITGGEVSNNTAIGGGGIFIDRDCVLTMTGGFIKGNNAETDQSVTHGDGVYVGGTFNVGDGVDGGPVVDENNDVYLPTGHVIDVISTFTGAIPDNPINITSEERDVEPETGDPAGTKLVNYHDEAGSIGAAQKADDDVIYVPSAKMLAQDPLLGIGKSMNENQLNYMTYVKAKPTLTLEMLNMVSYTGGDSSDDDPFPSPRYRLTMSPQLEALLGEDGLDGLSLSDADGNPVALHEVSDGTFVVSGLEESYEYKGLELSDADGVAAQNDSEAGVYEIALKDSERLVAVLVADGEEENEAPEGFDEDGEAAEALNNNVDISEDAGSELSDESPLNDDASTDVEVHITPAMLTVRYVNDSDAVASGQKSITVLAKKQSELNESDSSSFHLVLDDNAVLSTNGRKELGMVGNDVASDSSAPALLTDELLLADDGSSREPIMQRKAEEYLDGEGVSTAGRSWDFQYLDLVNANDGNVWIASSAGLTFTGLIRRELIKKPNSRLSTMGICIVSTALMVLKILRLL